METRVGPPSTGCEGRPRGAEGVGLGFQVRREEGSDRERDRETYTETGTETETGADAERARARCLWLCGGCMRLGFGFRSVLSTYRSGCSL